MLPVIKAAIIANILCILFHDPNRLHVSMYQQPQVEAANIADACCTVLTKAIPNPPATMAPIIANFLCIAIIAKYKHITSYTIIFETNQKELEFLAIY
jgi:hypothetical protein